jgi:hypothetical protein
MTKSAITRVYTESSPPGTRRTHSADVFRHTLMLPARQAGCWQDLQSCSAVQHTEAGSLPWTDSLLASLAVGGLLLQDGMRGACGPKLDDPAARAAEHNGAREGRSHHPGRSMLQDSKTTSIRVNNITQTCNIGRLTSHKFGTTLCWTTAAGDNTKALFWSQLPFGRRKFRQ